MNFGLSSDLLKRKGENDKAEQYLSLFATGRSVDLFFDTTEECQEWFLLLDLLVKKECNRMKELIEHIEPTAAGTTNEMFDRLVFAAVVGREC